MDPRTVGPHLIGTDVQRIDSAILHGLVKARRVSGATNATIKRDLSAIASVLAVAKAEGWVEANAARKFDRDQVKERRDPIPLPEEEAIAAVLAECPPAVAALARFARATGMRQDEIVQLRRAQIDRSRRAAQLSRTKHQRARSVPLSADAMAEVDAALPFVGSPQLFWEGDGHAVRNAATRFCAATRRAAQKAAQAKHPFQRFRFHDLRHLFAVEELRRWPDIYRLRDILGHGSVKQTEGYLAFLTPEEAAAARAGVGTILGTATAVSRSGEAI